MGMCRRTEDVRFFYVKFIDTLVTVQASMFREVFCFAKPEGCNEKAITEGDFAWLFHRYWNACEQ